MKFVPLLSRAAVAAGCDGIFLEVHIDPKSAKSDGANMIALSCLEDLLTDLIMIDAVVKRKSKGAGALTRGSTGRPRNRRV